MSITIMDPLKNQNPIVQPTAEPVVTPSPVQPETSIPQTVVTPETQITSPDSSETIVNQGTFVNQGDTQFQPDPPKHGLLFHLGVSTGIFIILTVLFLLPVLHGLTNYSFNGLGEAGSVQDSSATPGCATSDTSVDTGVMGFPLAYSFTRTMSSATNCHPKPCGGSFQALCSYQQRSSKDQVMAYSNVGLGLDVAVAFVLTLIISLVLFIVMKTRKPSQAEVSPPSGAMANVGPPQDVAQDEPNNS